MTLHGCRRRRSINQNSHCRPPPKGGVSSLPGVCHRTSVSCSRRFARLASRALPPRRRKRGAAWRRKGRKLRFPRSAWQITLYPSSAIAMARTSLLLWRREGGPPPRREVRRRTHGPTRKETGSARPCKQKHDTSMVQAFRLFGREFLLLDIQSLVTITV